MSDGKKDALNEEELESVAGGFYKAGKVGAKSAEIAAKLKNKEKLDVLGKQKENKAKFKDGMEDLNKHKEMQQKKTKKLGG